MKKTWEGINNVLALKLKNTKPITFSKDPNDNDSVTSDPSRIANVLNDHFASVGPKLANKLPTVQRNYFDFLNRSNSPDSLFAFNLVTPAVSWFIFMSYSTVEVLVKCYQQYTRGNNKSFYFDWDVSH